MATMGMHDLSEKMREIDFAMLVTHTEGGEIASRPMSNNGEVEYEGDSYFFTLEHERMVQDIAIDPRVGLTMQAGKHLLGKPGIMIAVEGRGELIRDKSAFAEHWTKSLDRWFEQGIDTPGLVLIKVHAKRIKYWDGMESGELKLS